jgi:serine protease Do
MNLWKRIGEKSSYVTLGLGIAMGLGAAAFLFRTGVVPKAQADLAMARPIAGISTESMATLRALDGSFASLADYIEPSVVHIRSESKGQTDLMGRRMGAVGGEGSGVIFRPDGWIVTNDHVVGGFDKVTVVLTDGREFPGRVIRSNDKSIDVSVVKIEAKDLPAAKFGDSRGVRPGQFAIAVGSPFGLENSVTIGHISALARQRVVGDARLGEMRVYSDFIQTDAPLNSGNSGGPLVNIEGQVIGINTAIYSGTGGNVGIGFAIPSNFARMIAEKLIEDGKLVRGYLGVLPENLKPYRMKEMNLDGGALVASVPNDGPAAVAGIKENDVIVKIGSAEVKSQQDLRTAMLRNAPGETVPVEFVRDGQHKTVRVKVAKLPEDTLIQDGAKQGSAPNFDPRELFPEFEGFGQGGPNPDEGDVAPLREGQAKLGVTVQNLTPELRSRYHIASNAEGAVVTAVEPGSVADRASVAPGDVLQGVGDKAIRSAKDVTEAMKGVSWGQSRQVKVTRFTSRGAYRREFPVAFR